MWYPAIFLKLVGRVSPRAWNQHRHNYLINNNRGLFRQDDSNCRQIGTIAQVSNEETCAMVRNLSDWRNWRHPWVAVQKKEVSDTQLHYMAMGRTFEMIDSQKCEVTLP